MGYKSKNWDTHTKEASFFILEKGIFKNLNVASLGYVTSRSLDPRFHNKVYKYSITLGPKEQGKQDSYYEIYDVACLEGIDITQEEISSGKCLVLVLFLDTNPKNLYSQVYGYNKAVSDKLGDTSSVEDIMHDYRNAIIVGKVKIQ
jgi:hypothetical protein